MTHEDLPIFVRWEKILEWLLSTTEKFPKSVRHTFSNRVVNMALDITERIVEAAYSRNKKDILVRTNLELEKLRVLMRISYKQHYLSTRSYEHMVKELYEVGRMLGGWIKDQQDR